MIRKTLYSRRWHTTTTPDLAFCTEDIHKGTVRTVGPQLGGSDHRPILLSIPGKETMITPQHPRWNYRKANWQVFKIRTNELLENLEVTGRNINNVIKDFNANIIKAAKECIPRGARKNYIPYWSSDLQKAHDNLTKAREDAEQKPWLKITTNRLGCGAGCLMVLGFRHRNTRYRAAYPLTTQRATCGIRLLVFPDTAMVAVLETQPDN